MSAAAAATARVGAFYERHPYPPPQDDLEAYRRRWDASRRLADSHLFWPAQPFRDDRRILVAGCGTSQAAKYAMRWPRAKVVGIDLSAGSIRFTTDLKRKHGLDNLEVRQLPVERADELGQAFDHVVCTGVLHHLADPDAGLRALRDVTAPDGALHLMVYAPYGRAGVYLLQDYCRRLGIRPTPKDIADLVASLRDLPPDHPLVPLLRISPDFRTAAAIADALLNPQDRAYSTPQLFDFLERSGVEFGRWIRQAAYLPQCGALASSPHGPLMARLPAEAQYAAVELFRGTMVSHSLAAYRDDRPAKGYGVTFEGDAWRAYVPLRLGDTVSVRERLPEGASAVLINRGHRYTDLYLPIGAQQATWLAAIDGKRSIGEIAPQPANREAARAFFQQLWNYDQVVFDASREAGPG